MGSGGVFVYLPSVAIDNIEYMTILGSYSSRQPATHQILIGKPPTP